MHVFRLINIRENPLNWVIKRLRGDPNGESRPARARAFHLRILISARFYSLVSLCSRARELGVAPHSILARLVQLDVQLGLI